MKRPVGELRVFETKPTRAERLAIVEEKLRTKWHRERFWSKVDRRGPDECWPWTAAVRGPDRRHKYGQIGFFLGEHEGKRINWPFAAHIVAWTLAEGGKLPEWPAEHICHTCDNPLCCNPAHLYKGTAKTNLHDAIARGRMPKKRKLDWGTVEEIRRLRSRDNPPSLRELGRRFGHPFQEIHKIVKGVTYRKRWRDYEEGHIEKTSD